jgi:maltose alpha-D-glucosyltransferase/alpha-amylase
MPLPRRKIDGLESNPLWYKSGVIYEVHVRAFYDANGDGSGDFRGLTQKLDYIKDLGVTAIWLLPFYPSPQKDDGYDIADYYDVHPMFGTLADFKNLLRGAHNRGLRVITELVLNHTSDQHPWFQRARRAKPGSRWRNYYVWSDTPQKYKDARIIFKDVEVSNWQWDHEAQAYFWHRFFSHQPDLNFDNPEVHEALFKVVDFWFGLGVDGLRLDAVPYLYEREGTNCENLPETHEFLKKLRAHVDANFKERILIAEANQWPDDAVVYFGHGRGDACHMAFHFPLMPRLFMALRMEDRLPIVDILEQTPPIPETCQWALFLRNHDELTLEMVTDEERDYMYRMYAQVHQARLNLGIRRRLAPLLNNDRKSIELLNALLFSLPGTPVLYYGDEIGLGENIYLGDRDGVRTPMQWSSDKNAGFSRANPQSLYLPIILDPAYHYEAVNVEAQLANPHSQLWWMRRVLALRKRWRALGEGKCEFLQPANNKILSYLLRFEQEIILVVANLSRFTQPVELDLSGFKDFTPIELFGRTQFPVITDARYFLTLGPHNFYWFSLEPKAQPVPAGLPRQSAGAGGEPPVPLRAITVKADWMEIFAGPRRAKLEALLPEFLKSRPWFVGASRNIKFVTIRDIFKVLLSDETVAALVLLQVDYVDANSETLALPLVFASGLANGAPRENAVAALSLSDNPNFGIVYEAFALPQFANGLFNLISRRESLENERGEVEAIRLPTFRASPEGATGLKVSVRDTPQGNVGMIFGDKIVLKCFRRLGQDENPELEIGRFLTERNFPHCTKLLGALQYTNGARSTVGKEQMTLAVAKAFVPHATDGWKFTLDAITRYYDQVFADAAQGRGLESAPAVGPHKSAHHPAGAGPEVSAQARQNDAMPARITAHVETYLEFARLLGERTAELHLALASEESGEFCAEPMTPHHLRGTFQSMRFLAVQTLRRLRKQIKFVPPKLLQMAQQVADLEPAILKHCRRLVDETFEARRIRIQGDLHLGAVLWTGRDFLFSDFAGDASLPISQRRIKRSPLRDVARMLRSFHHAAYAGFNQQVNLGVIQPENLERFEPWVRHWNLTVSRAYLQAYFPKFDKSGIFPREEEKLRIMLRAYLLHQVMGELADTLRVGFVETNNTAALPLRNSLRVPLRAIVFLTEEPLPMDGLLGVINATGGKHPVVI